MTGAAVPAAATVTTPTRTSDWTSTAQPTSEKAVPVDETTSTVHEVPLCASSDSYIFPRRALNKENKFRFIVNAPNKRYVQLVRVRRMRNVGTADVDAP